MTDKQLIRAEIERRITDNTFGAKLELIDILAWLDTLPDEPVSEDLEEAADEYIAPIENDAGLEFINFSGKDIKDAFIAGAEWQYQKDRGEFAKIKAKTWCEGFDAHKEQILKEAVEADVNIYRDLAEGKSWAEFVVEMPTNNLGDKVKIIIVKEDEK